MASEKKNERIIYTRRPGRWLVLIGYMFIAAVSQMLLLNFAPILTQIQSKYDVTELVASLLIMVFPLLYLVFSLHAGSWVDKKGYRFTVGLGSIVMAFFSLFRIYDESFYALLLGQVGIAIAQPYILNGITKLVSDWFDSEQAAIATGLGTMGLIIGMAVGLGVTPSLVEAYEIKGAMIIFSAITIISSIVFFILVHPNSMAPVLDEVTALKGAVWKLIKNKDLLRLFFMGFLGIGYYNGVTTWLEPMLAVQGIGSKDAGMIGAVINIGGILGAVIIPTLSDTLGKRKPFLILCTIIGMAITYPLCLGSNVKTLMGLAVTMGFFLLPMLALLLAMTEEIAGAELAGSATGILMFMGNAGAVIIIIGMEVAKGDSSTFVNSVYFALGALAIAFVLAIVSKEPRQVRKQLESN